MKRKFAFRIDESDYQMLKTKAKRGKITMTDFIIRAIIGREIIVVEGVRELISELKAIGRNLNQLTASAIWASSTRYTLPKPRCSSIKFMRSCRQFARWNSNGDREFYPPQKAVRVVYEA